jgi:hypothetical protein
MEFFRARDIATFGGLTRVQWMIAALLGVMALVLVVRERMAPVRVIPPLSPSARLLRLTCVACTPIVLLLAGGSFFAPLESLVLSLVTVPSLLLLVRPWLAGGRGVGYRLASPAGVSFALTILAVQQIPSTNATAAAGDPSYPTKRWSWGVSAAQSEDYEDRVVGSSYGDCGPSPLYEEFDVRYRLLGTTLTRTTRTGPAEGHVLRFRGFAGKERAVSTESPTRATTVTTLGGVGTSMTLDRQNFGLTGGLAIGTFSGDSSRASAAGTLGLRLGSVDGLHAFAGINDVEPLGVRDMIARAGLGYAFGATGSAIRAGVWESGRPFIGGTFAVGGFEIEPNAVIHGNHDIRLSVSRPFSAAPPR